MAADAVLRSADNQQDTGIGLLLRCGDDGRQLPGSAGEHECVSRYDIIAPPSAFRLASHNAGTSVISRVFQNASPVRRCRLIVLPWFTPCADQVFRQPAVVGAQRGNQLEPVHPHCRRQPVRQPGIGQQQCEPGASM